MKKIQYIILIFCTFNIYAQTQDVDFTGNCSEGKEVYYDSDNGPVFSGLKQSFTAQLSGYLTKVAVILNVSPCDETSTMNLAVEIFEGTCPGTILTSEIITLSTTTNLNASIREINFSSPVSILQGQVYYIQLRNPEYQLCQLGSGYSWEARVFWYGEDQNNTSNCGLSYLEGEGFGPFCINHNFDFYFQTYVSSSLSTNEFETNGSVNIYPNPSNNYITVSGLTKNKSYTIYNILGIKVYSGKLSNNYKINISNLENGIYLLNLKDGNVIKFIKK